MTRISKEVTGTPFAMDQDMYYDLQTIVKRLTGDKVKDAVIVVGGKVGSGKTTLAMQIAKFLSLKLHTPFNLDIVVFTPTQIYDAIMNEGIKENGVVIYDESSTGVTGKQSMTKEGKMLELLFDTCRVKRAAIIICTPRFRSLSKALVEDRILGMYETKDEGAANYYYPYNRNDMIKYYNILRNPTLRKKLNVGRIRKHDFGAWPFSRKSENLGCPFTEEEYNMKKVKSLASVNSEGSNAWREKYIKWKGELYRHFSEEHGWSKHEIGRRYNENKSNVRTALEKPPLEGGGRRDFVKSTPLPPQIGGKEDD